MKWTQMPSCILLESEEMIIHMDAIEPYLYGFLIFLLLLVYTGIAAFPIMAALSRGSLIMCSVFGLLYAAGCLMIVGLSTGFVQISLH